MLPAPNQSGPRGARRSPASLPLSTALLVMACGGARPAPALVTPAPVPAVAATAQPEVDTTPAEPQTPAPATVLEGTFSGTIWSGGEFVPIETRLLLTQAGGSGSYTFVENEESYPGTLTNCVPASYPHFTCTWQDAFGSGVLDLAVRFDQQAFEGVWWPAEEPADKHPWSGNLSGEPEEPSNPDAEPEVDE